MIHYGSRQIGCMAFEKGYAYRAEVRKIKKNLLKFQQVLLAVVQECNSNPNHFPRMQLLTLLQR